MTEIPPDLLARSMPSGWQTAFTIAMVVPTFVLIAVALRYWRRGHDPVPLLCLVGGAAACLVEPIIDVLALCWYPRHGQWRLMTILGRDTPFLVLPGYMWFMGGFMALTYIRLGRGAGVADIVKLYVLFIAANVLVEVPGVHTHIYYYYGHQPLKLLGWPVWWGFVNCAIGIVGGCAVYALRSRQLNGRVEALALVAMIPMVDAAVNLGTGWPLFSALSSPGWSGLACQFAGIVTCLLAILAVLISANLISGRTEGTPIGSLGSDLLAA